MKRFVLLIKKLKKDIAYKNNRFNAFTLIEMLFSFSIFCIVLSLIPPLFQTVTVLNKQVNDTSLINFEFFAQDITRELNDIPIKNITVENNHLVVKHEDELTNYTFTKEKIYKTIDGKGNITLLQNLKDFKIAKINNKYIMVDIILIEDNKEYYKKLFI